jgi:hypothetical protein
MESIIETQILVISEQQTLIESKDEPSEHESGATKATPIDLKDERFWRVFKEVRMKKFEDPPDCYDFDKYTRGH